MFCYEPSPDDILHENAKLPLGISGIQICRVYFPNIFPSHVFRYIAHSELTGHNVASVNKESQMVFVSLLLPLGLLKGSDNLDLATNETQNMII